MSYKKINVYERAAVNDVSIYLLILRSFVVFKQKQIHFLCVSFRLRQSSEHSKKNAVECQKEMEMENNTGEKKYF